MTIVYERDFSAGLSGKYSLAFERVKAGTKVLELACSTGYFSQVLSQKGCAVTGIDSDP
jgi:2-polyprenyl-3-methyl-5-hydroxy-6-metoxy-1,4-benzoquinol methylase